MTPEMPPDPAGLSMRRLVAAAAAERRQAWDILLGDAISVIRSEGHGGVWCEDAQRGAACRGCEVIQRYQDSMLGEPP